MKRCLAFAYMDLETVRPYAKTSAVILLLGIGMGFLLRAELFPPLMLLLCFLIFASYPFAVAEKNDMDALYAVLPIGRNFIVLGRYLFAAALLFAAMLVAFAAAALVDAVYSLGIGAGGIAAEILGFASVGAVVTALQFPVYFRFGYTKAKLAAMLPVLVFSAGAALLGTLIPDFGDRLAAVVSAPLFLALAPVTAAALFAASAALSCAIYSKRDL